MNENVYLVVPTIRNLDFLKAWQPQFESVHLIIVEDHRRKEIKIPRIACRSLTHYTQTDIEKDLGKKAWIFPKRSAAIRSYGFWKAWQAGADVIMTIDDDCFPATPNFVDAHLENLKLRVPSQWAPTYPFRELLFTRGFPYLVRNELPVKLSHGIWSQVPDFDGLTQLMSGGTTYAELPSLLHIIPPKMFFPMSAMNIAFTKEITVLMYQLLMGHDREENKLPYDRFDDIWSGIFAKKILDHLKMGVVSGTPFVRHDRASNVFTNIKKEASGIEKNEELWKAVQKVKLTTKSPITCYQELASKIHFPDESYFSTLRQAMLEWAELFL